MLPFCLCIFNVYVYVYFNMPMCSAFYTSFCRSFRPLREGGPAPTVVAGNEAADADSIVSAPTSLDCRCSVWRLTRYVSCADLCWLCFVLFVATGVICLVCLLLSQFLCVCMVFIYVLLCIWCYLCLLVSPPLWTCVCLLVFVLSLFPLILLILPLLLYLFVWGADVRLPPADGRAKAGKREQILD